MNLFTGKRTIWHYSSVVLCTIGFVLFAHTAVSEKLSHAHTVAAMLSTESCDAPCLFGMPLKNASYAQMQMLLENSPLTHDADFSFESEYISWQWPENVVSWLISDEYQGLSRFQDINYVNFQNGAAWDVNIVFALPLEDIVDVFGDDFLIYPYADYGRGNIYGLVYEEPKGMFTAWLDCDEPRMTAATLVASYYYRETLTIDSIDMEIAIPWQGYDTELPDCSAFQSG